LGKYSKVAKDLPRAEPVAGEFQDRVNALKDNIPDWTPGALARGYAEAKDAKKEHEEKEKELNIRVAAFEQLISLVFGDQDISSVRLEDGRPVSVNPEPYAVVIDRDALNAWVAENNLDRLRTLSWQTTNALAKERLLAGDAPPDGVELKLRDAVRITKAR
jgi:hypothetical protein